EEPADGRRRARHLTRREHVPVLEGQQVPGVYPRRRDDQDVELWHRRLRRHGVRPSGTEAVVWHRGLYARRQDADRAAPVRSLGRSGGGLRTEEPHQRPGQEGRGSLPLRPHRARLERGAWWWRRRRWWWTRRRPRRRARHDRPVEAGDSLGVR